MRENTPPHVTQDIDDEFANAEDGEFIYFDDFEEITEAELESLPTMGNYETEQEDDSEFFTEDEEEVNVVLVDNSIVTFSKHTAPVFSCSMHPTKQWAATGGQDDKAFIWDRQTGETICEINGHRDTVISVKFSYDGNYLATGDMSGEIFVYKLNGDVMKVWEYSMGDMTWMKWHRAAHVLLAGAESGEIYIWRIPSGDCKILPGKGSKCETAELAADGKKLFAGYADGVVKLWDMKNSNSLIEVDSSNPMGHTDSVLSVSCDTDSSMYASCGEDGNILLTSNNGPIGVMNCGVPLEVIILAPYPDLKIAATGTVFNQVTIWDYLKQTVRSQCDHAGGGVTTMKWLPDYTLLVATISGALIGYDARNGAYKFDLKGHSAQIYEMCYNQYENIILTASEDCTAKIFRYS